MRLCKLELSWLGFLVVYGISAAVINLVVMALSVYVFHSNPEMSFNLIITMKYLALAMAVSTVIPIIAAFFFKRLKIRLVAEKIEQDQDEQ